MVSIRIGFYFGEFRFVSISALIHIQINKNKIVVSFNSINMLFYDFVDIE